MSETNKDSDRIVLKQKKGIWKRFIKLFPKCRLPWIWLAVYIVINFGVIHIGINETDYTGQLFAGDTSFALVSKLIGTLIINLIGANIVVFVGGITSARITRNMRIVLFDKILKLPMSYFKDENPRDAIYRIVGNASVIENTLMFFIIPILSAAYTALAVFRKVFKYDWRLSVILLGFIPIQVLVAFIFGRLNYSLSERNSAVNSGLMQKLSELVTNIPLAKAFAKENQETKNGEELTARLYKLNIKSSWLGQFKDLSETVLSLLQSAVIVLVGILLLRNEEITTKAWIMFFLFSSVFSGAITQFMMYWNNLKNIQGGAEKVAEIMNEFEESSVGEPCDNLTGDIKLGHIQFGYDESKPIFTDLNCEFKDNCVTALLGVSGCGKTTLVNLLTRLYEPQGGEASINGRSIYDYSLDSYRNQFVMVSQNAMLFSGTVRENVCYGNGDVSEEDLIDALKKSGSYDFVMNMKEGLETRIEEYGNNLSGGQRQRLAMARALLSDAHYFILDEPAASMDALAESELMEILKSVSRSRCTIIIAHTSAVLSIADRVVIIENGIVSSEGETAELQKTNAFLREFSGKEVSE